MGMSEKEACTESYEMCWRIMQLNSYKHTKNPCPTQNVALWDESKAAAVQQVCSLGVSVTKTFFQCHNEAK